MSLYFVLSFYAVGIISCLPRVTPSPALPNHPGQNEARRNLRMQNITTIIVMVIWTVLLCFSALQDTLSFIIFPVVWGLYITIIWLAKVYQLLFFSILELSIIPFVQMVLFSYVLSLIAFGLMILPGLQAYLGMFYLHVTTDSTKFNRTTAKRTNSLLRS